MKNIYCAVHGCAKEATPSSQYCTLHAEVTPTAMSILASAVGHLNERAATYDKSEGERSIAKTVQMFNLLTGDELTEEQGWLFMTLLKMGRAQSGNYRADSYEDGAAYFALAGEAAAQERV